MMKTPDRKIETNDVARDRTRAIGAILVEQGRLTADDVEEIQQYSIANGLRFGDGALRLQKLTQQDVDLAIAQQFNYPILERGGRNGVSDELVAGYLPQSEMIEPLRALRSQITLRWVNSQERNALAITSAGRGEGRTWLAANLAIVFAQLGRRTLIIDADMRNPRLHTLFNLENTVGLSALLTGRAGREIVTRVHPQLRLFVLPAGIVPPNPQELLGRPVFDVVLNLFADQYDLIIMDTPACTVASDAYILSSRAGTAVMVARRNHTNQTDLNSAMQNLVQTGVNVIGSVMTDF
jgi:receptor protein-tyrosine kinase